jgi:F-type H+/Na+-transporting ATPase subunit beta
MIEDFQLNVPLLRRRVPNLTAAARTVGLRPATVSNLCTGKIPVARAEVRTLVALASLAGCSLDELILHGDGMGMIETGIKVLDFFAPIVRGGTVGFIARQRMGQYVLLAELLHRARMRGYTTVFWLPQEEGIGVPDVVAKSDETSRTLDETYDRVSSLRANHDVLVAVDRSAFVSGELLDLRGRLQEPGNRPVTMALADIRGEVVDEDVPYGPLDVLWRFDMDLVARQLYPAIDPIASTSTLLEGAQLEAQHLALQQRARKLLRRYRELRALVSIHGTDKLPDAELFLYHRGARLEAFFAQPLFVAEPFTGKSGEWMPIEETLFAVRGILDGESKYDKEEIHS